MRALPPRWKVFLLGSALLVAAAGTVRAAVVEFPVNCDAGGSLAATLRRACRYHAFRPDSSVVVAVTGTCRGNFSVGCDGITIRGFSPSQAALVGPLGPDGKPVDAALKLRDVHDVQVENLTLTGGAQGLLVLRASGGASGCRFTSNTDGVHVEGSPGFELRASVADSNDRFGILALGDGSVSVDGTTVSANGQDGIFGYGVSQLLVANSEITGNASVGIDGTAGTHLYLADNTGVYDNLSGFDVIVSDLAELETGSFGSPVVVSSFSGGWVVVSEKSYLESFPDAYFLGNVLIWNGSDAFLHGAQVYGGIAVDTFSRLLLDGAALGGGIECYNTSDALCGGCSAAYAMGCPSLLAAMTPPAGGASARPAFPAERFEEIRRRRAAFLASPGTVRFGPTSPSGDEKRSDETPSSIPAEPSFQRRERR